MREGSPGELRRHFVDQLPGRLRVIRADVLRLQRDGWSTAAAETVYRLVHGVAGSAATFGVTEVADAAGALEALLAARISSGLPPGEVAWAELIRLLDRVEGLAAQARIVPGETGMTPGTPRAAPGPALEEAAVGGGPLLHLVEDDALQAEHYAELLRAAGYRVEVFGSPAEFRSRFPAALSERPSAVIMDLVFPEGSNLGVRLIEELGLGSEGGVPVIVISVRDDLAARLAAFRAGAVRYLLKPVEPARLVAVVDAISGRVPMEPYRVLLVDDDELLLEVNAEVLRSAGMEVRGLAQPMQLLRTADEFQPDVIVLDVYFPDATGPELTAVLRERDGQLHTPILLLSGEGQAARQARALGHGADAFLQKPVQPEELIAAVVARARRGRQYDAVRRRLQNTVYERERVQLALDQHAIVSVADAAGDLVYVNDRFCAVSGFSRGELIGQNHRLLKSGVHPLPFYQGMWATLMRGEVWAGEICDRAKDGSLFWVKTTIVPYLGSDGQPYQFVSIRTDITSAKRAEGVLRRQRDAQRVVSAAAGELLAASASQLDAAVDRALRFLGEFLDADRGYLMLFTPDGLYLDNTHEWCAPGIAPQRHRVQRVPLTSMTWWYEQVKRGGALPIHDVEELPREAAAEQEEFRQQEIRSLITYPLQRDERLFGAVGFDMVRRRREWSADEARLLAVVADVIASALLRVGAERSAEASEERLRRGQRYANIGTWDGDVRTGRLIWSERVAPLFGHPAGEGETTYERFIEAVHPEDRSRVAAAIEACIKRDVPLEVEHRVVWPDGTVRWLLERGAATRDADGRAVQLVGVVQDITARVEAELALVAARDEADRANQAKSEFLSSMSHELRTPMNVILGFGQLMGYDDALPEGHKDNVRQILKAGQHLLELINEVLDLARVESGHIELSLEPVESGPIVAECLGLVKTMADNHLISIGTGRVDAALVRADRTRLKQALLNLLSNAIKYNRPGGRVTVNAVPGAAGRLRFEVDDTGPGIAAERLEELFQPFNRLDAGNSEIEGTGIGLTITRRLVDLMGGEVGVASELGSGSTFWIELPLESLAATARAEEATLAGSEAWSRELADRRQTVLYVEDNPANIKLVAQILARRENIRLLTTHASDLGIELARSRRPDLVLLDINMPGMDGYQVLRELRADPGTRTIPVIAVTANAMPRDLERARAAGFDDYLSKPLDLSLFLKAVDAALAFQARRTEAAANRDADPSTDD